ncbi:MAG TPA: right-handed parallel beta-helix repeat-containing protein [Halococcus sp.]|nr:right-handed parallel beta-helix repeat-containing protein [Halococcus sp.]
MKPPRRRSERRRVFAVVLIIVLVAAASVGVASAQRSRNTTIDSCTTIDTPGRYVLTQDIRSTISGANEGCIEITASNVTLDGAGHTLTGSGSGHGVEVDGSKHTLRNVTVKRLQASNWSVGIFYLSATNGTIRGTITNNNTEGIALGQSTGNELVKNTAYDNAIGIALGGESQHNTIRHEVAVENKWGIHFERDSGNNTVTNSVAQNNTRWDYYSREDGAENTATGIQLSAATVSLTGENVGLRSVASPPPLPRGTENLNTYIEVAGTHGPSSLSLTIHYDSSRDVSLWRYDGQHWSKIESAQVDASANTISANLTQFGLFAVLADAPNSNGGPVTVTPNQPVSVQRTLTTVPQTTQTPTPTSSNESAASGAAAATRTPTTPESKKTPQNASKTTGTDVAHGESNAATSTFGVGPVKLFFVVVGLVALVGLVLVAVRQRR